MGLLTPATLATVMKSRSRRLSTSPRTIRAYQVQ